MLADSIIAAIASLAIEMSPALVSNEAKRVKLTCQEYLAKMFGADSVCKENGHLNVHFDGAMARIDMATNVRY